MFPLSDFELELFDLLHLEIVWINLEREFVLFDREIFTGTQFFHTVDFALAKMDQLKY